MVAGNQVRTNMANLSYFEKETQCEFQFRNTLEEFGGLWHYCTPGELNMSVNITPEDYDFSVNNLAISAAETGVTILTDSHMTNHLHALLACRREQCFALEDAYLYRLGKRLLSQGRSVSLEQFRCKEPIPITDLTMARNEAVYINRNRYVVDPRYTPFSDPWSGASVFFNVRNNEAGSIAFNDLPFRTKREICMRSKPVAPDTYRFREGRILASSYLAYELGESFFRDAHHYLSMLTRKAEIYSEVAKRLGDSIVLTEEELYQAVRQIAIDKYGLKQASLLPPKAKMEVAATMHHDYKATNAQILRMLKLDPGVIGELFPSSSVK